MIRRKRLRTLRASVVGVLSAGMLAATMLGPGEARATSRPTVKVGYLSGLSATGPLAIAHYAGFFKQAGIHVQAIPFTTGPAEMDAMASGAINVAFLGSGADFLPMKGLGTIIGVPDIGFATQVIASPNSGIHSFSQLKGKTIMLAENTTAEGLLYTALQSVGLSLKDVHMINIPPAGQVSAFMAGHAPVVITWAPFSTKIEQQMKKAIVLGSNKTFYPRIAPPATWVASKPFLKQSPDLAVRFLWAFNKANDYRFHYPRRYVDWTHQMNGQPTTLLAPQVPLIAHISSSQMMALFRNGTMNRWLQETNRRFVAIGLLPKMVPVSSYFDPSYALAATHGLQYHPQTSATHTPKTGSPHHTPLLVGALVILVGLGLGYRHLQKKTRSS